jgi:uncharacterized membrane protein
MSGREPFLTPTTRWVLLAIAAASALVAAWAIAQVPAGEAIPIHWNAAGEADGFGSRWWLLIGPGMVVLTVGLAVLIARVEPRQANITASYGPLRTFAVVMAGFGLLLTLAMALSAIGNPIEVGAWISVAVGLLIAAIGTLLGRIRSNYTFGVRTPWTLASDRSWQRTHRIIGLMWVVIGLATAALGLAGLPEASIWVLVGGIMLSLVVAFWYSYVVWRDDPDKEPTGR